jgi:hypothetical protein
MCHTYFARQPVNKGSVSLQPTLANEHARNNCEAVEVFSLGSVPVMTSCNSRGIGDGVFFVVRSRAI